MSHTLREQFKTLKHAEGHINPDPAWVATTRTSLLDAIATHAPVEVVTKPERGTVATQLLRFIPMNMFSFARPILVSLLVFVLATSGWMTNASAAESLPGDALWRIKLAGEKTQVVIANITGNDTKNVDLQLKFAARRADEIKIISNDETFDKEEKVKRTEEGLEKLKQNISSVGEAVKSAGASDDQKNEIGQKAKAVNIATDQISATLKEVANTVQDDSEKNISFTKNVVAIKQTVDDVGLDVIRVAVEAAKSDEERSVATQLVEQKIVSALSDADGALTKTAEVKTLIQQVDTRALSSGGLGTLTTTSTTAVSVSGSASSSVVIPPTTSSVTDVGTGKTAFLLPPPTTKDLVTTILGEVDRTSVEVQERIKEIKQLIEAGDVTTALEKVKELKKITNDSAQKTNEIQKVVLQVVTDQAQQKTNTPVTLPSPTKSTVLSTSTPTTPTTTTISSSSTVSTQKSTSTEPLPKEVSVQ